MRPAIAAHRRTRRAGCPLDITMLIGIQDIEQRRHDLEPTTLLGAAETPGAPGDVPYRVTCRRVQQGGNRRVFGCSRFDRREISVVSARPPKPIVTSSGALPLVSWYPNCEEQTIGKSTGNGGGRRQRRPTGAPGSADDGWPRLALSAPRHLRGHRRTTSSANPAPLGTRARRIPRSSTCVGFRSISYGCSRICSPFGREAD